MQLGTDYKIYVYERSTTMAITLGRYDILAHVMPMSRFRLAPKIGHLERM